MASLPSGVTANSGVQWTTAISAFIADLRRSLPTSIPMHVTSGARSTDAQARAMGEKVRLGENLRALYPDSLADAVTAAYPDQAAMAKVIGQFAAQGVGSRHLAGQAVDLRSYTLNSSQIQQVLATAKQLGATQAIYETTPAHIHVSIPAGYRGTTSGSLTQRRSSTPQRSKGSSEIVWTAGAAVVALIIVAAVASRGR